jgi:hypothetical protein
MVRMAVLAFLPLALANWTLPDGNIYRFSDNAEITERRSVLRIKMPPRKWPSAAEPRDQP